MRKQGQQQANAAAAVAAAASAAAAAAEVGVTAAVASAAVMAMATAADMSVAVEMSVAAHTGRLNPHSLKPIKRLPGICVSVLRHAEQMQYSSSASMSTAWCDADLGLCTSDESDRSDLPEKEEVTKLRKATLRIPFLAPRQRRRRRVTKLRKAILRLMSALQAAKTLSAAAGSPSPVCFTSRARI